MSDTVREPRRADAVLVERELARSRQLASEAIRAGRVSCNGHRISKPSHRVADDDELTIDPLPGEHYVSRGAHKLVGALDALRLDVRGLRCIDLGASTGGFTQVLLERGAQQVTAIDVGTDQLAASLRADPRVRVLENTHLGRDDLGAIDPAAFVVADLSFISLRHVMAPMTALVAEGGVLLPMVKPQFEVGRGKLGRGGVVADRALHRQVVQETVHAAAAHGFGAQHITRSALPGPAGNIEFFVQLRRGVPAGDFDVLWAQCAESDMSN
ncbi:TlyA family RNA methyltransferase [Cumulibacter soli]|uniref:TlyA family RNA methyltransferase n=1 Tax=Cumulibacter soli TaxID=2546344 RepID=UPI001067657C|nr:TlyA family RNA methyltransferase [Cumulibacter soli]